MPDCRIYGLQSGKNDMIFPQKYTGLQSDIFENFYNAFYHPSRIVNLIFEQIINHPQSGTIRRILVTIHHPGEGTNHSGLSRMVSRIPSGGW